MESLTSSMNFTTELRRTASG